MPLYRFGSGNFRAPRALSNRVELLDGADGSRLMPLGLVQEYYYPRAGAALALSTRISGGGSSYAHHTMGTCFSRRPRGSGHVLDEELSLSALLADHQQVPRMNPGGASAPLAHPLVAVSNHDKRCLAGSQARQNRIGKLLDDNAHAQFHSQLAISH